MEKPEHLEEKPKEARKRNNFFGTKGGKYEFRETNLDKDAHQHEAGNLPETQNNKKIKEDVKQEGVNNMSTELDNVKNDSKDHIKINSSAEEHNKDYYVKKYKEFKRVEEIIERALGENWMVKQVKDNPRLRFNLTNSMLKSSQDFKSSHESKDSQTYGYHGLPDTEGDN